jgi:hypothetical protein
MHNVRVSRRSAAMWARAQAACAAPRLPPALVAPRRQLTGTTRALAPPLAGRAAAFEAFKLAAAQAVRPAAPLRVSYDAGGAVVDATSAWRPVMALKEVGDGGADPFVAAAVNGRTIGLGDTLGDVLSANELAPGAGALRVELLRFSSVEGKKVSRCCCWARCRAFLPRSCCHTFSAPA